MIYVALTFHPKQKNPARESGLGVYRVSDCWERYFGNDESIRVVDGELVMPAARRYIYGSRVDPLKIALAARQLTA
jgi:hypothetical protein